MFFLDYFIKSRASDRSSRLGVFCKKCVLTNFTKFTGKHLCLSLFNKIFKNFFKKETPAQVFSCKFCEIIKNTFFYRTLPVAASGARSFQFPLLILLRVNRSSLC